MDLFIFSFFVPSVLYERLNAHIHTYNYKSIYNIHIYIYLRRRWTCINSISSTIELPSLLVVSSRRYATRQKTADAIKFNNLLVDMNVPLSDYSEYDYSASSVKCAFVYTVTNVLAHVVWDSPTYCFIFTLFAFVLTCRCFFLNWFPSKWISKFWLVANWLSVNSYVTGKRGTHINWFTRQIQMTNRNTFLSVTSKPKKALFDRSATGASKQLLNTNIRKIIASQCGFLG